jgi:DNA-binding MarR family transcriptional regulator
MNFNKNLINTSWGARYILLLLTKLVKSKIHSIVRDKTISELSNLSYLSERSVSNHIKELQDLELIEVERDLIFGKGRGVNSYKLYERFDLKFVPSGYQNLIIERIFFINDLTPIQKFVLIILISEADEFGVVRDVGFAELIKVSGISRSSLKQNLKEMIRNEFVYGFTQGGNIPICTGKVKGVFYLNFARFSGKDFSVPTDDKNLKNLKLTQRFNKDYKFVDIDALEYFTNHGSSKMKEYLSTLTDHSLSTLLSITANAADFATGALLTNLKQREEEFQPLLNDLKQNAFTIGIGSTIKSVDYGEIKRCVDANTDFEWKKIYQSISKGLFRDSDFDFSLNDGLDELRKEIYQGIKYLVSYFTFRIYFQLVASKSYPVKFAIARRQKFMNKDKEAPNFNLVLLQA